MSGRSYLSIGDVLTLLRQEFPDVTISKIRFLESQGLVNPERTPSGYRKFYDADVERLRWVLRQQREHFLPLKVIKDRLEEREAAGASTVPADAPVPTHAASSVTGAGSEVEVGVGAANGSEVGMGGQPAALVTSAARQAVPPAAAVAARRAVDRPSVGRPSVDNGPPDSAGIDVATPVVPDVARARPPVTAATLGHGDPTASSPSRPDAPSQRAERSGGTEQQAPVGPSPMATEAARTRPNGGPEPWVTGQVDVSSSAGGSAGGVVEPVPLQATTSVPAGVGLTADELATAAGADPAMVGQLREFSLISPVVLGGVEYFDEAALAVAKLAVAFAAFGIEPRHLRLYKHATEREAGFVEQVVLPLLRQRNPEARGRAAATAAELARLGQALRAELMHQALVALLGHDAVTS